MDNFEEELPSSWVENENGSIDWFSREIALESFVDSDSVNIGIIHKPNNLICE